MNLWLIRVVLWLMILNNFCCKAGENSTSASCPIRPAADLRGPPGIPGRQGPEGLGW